MNDRPGGRRREVFPVLRAYFTRYVATHGVIPDRNKMMRQFEAELGIGQAQTRADWTRLRDEYQASHTGEADARQGHAAERPPEETDMHETVRIESPLGPPGEHPAPDARDLAAVRQQLRQCQQEVSQLRQLVQTLAPARDVEGELPSRVARVEARQVGQERAIVTLEDQMRVVALKVNAHDTVVMTVQELLALLSVNDDAYDTLERLIRPASSHSQRTLQRFLWGKIGRKLHTNDFIPTP